MLFKTIIIFALVYFKHISAAGYFQDVTNKNITHIIHGSYFGPTTLKLKNHLVFVSYLMENYKLKMKIEYETSPARNLSKCEVALPNSDNRVFQNPTAEILGNGKIVTAFVELRQEAAKADPEVYLTIYVSNILDNCQIHNFSVAFDNEVLFSHDPLKILPYKDTFDIFVRSHKYCTPASAVCVVRFSDKGDTLGNFQFKFKTAHNNFDLEKIYSVKQFESSEGYIYLSLSSSTIKKLNEKFEVIQERKYNRFIATHSVLNGAVGICTNVASLQPHIECYRLDQSFNDVRKYELVDTVSFSVKTLQNLPGGDSLFVMILKGDKTSIIIRKLSRHDERISKPEYYRYGCEAEVSNPLIRFQELESRYCFSFACKYKYMTHCVDLSAARNLTLFS